MVSSKQPRVYAMGDIHGRFQPIRDFWLRAKLNQKMTDNPEDQVLILLGDAGLNFFLNERDEKLKKKLGSYPFTYFVVRGNHEERPSNLARQNSGWRKEVFFGNEVWVEEKFPYIKYAMDYPEVYFIPYGENKLWRTLIIPGAYSVDKYYRLRNGLTWFEDEQLTQEEMKEGLLDIELMGYSCDLVLSHTCPCIFIPTDLFLSQVDQSTVDKTMERYLGHIEYVLDYKCWLWGHYHAFRDYPRDDGKKKIMLSEEAIDLNQVMKESTVNIL